jgi:hypothetical protein
VLQLKIRPGDCIAIGEGVVVEIVRDQQGKMALQIHAAPDASIRRLKTEGVPVTPGAPRSPR